MEAYVYSASVTVLACVLILALAFRAGMSRKGGVSVLETYTTTNEPFIIANRVHMNTLENLVVFLPLLWVATIYGSAIIAPIIGLVWLISRVLFATAYTKNPKKRTPAFMVNFFSLVALVGLSAYGLVMAVV